MNRQSSAMFESLEGRRLLSTITLSTAGLLTVTGNPNLANTITVADSADGKSVVASVASGGVTSSKTFVATTVKKLVVNGGKLADKINVGQSGKAFAIPTTVNGGAGADVIHTGPEADNIHGGDGNDSIYAGAGNDTVHGDAGDDLIHGGDGNDQLWGGAGKDIIFGDAGNDLLGGILGANAGYGGTGTDTFVVAKTLAGSFPVNDFVKGTDVIKVSSTES